MTRIIFPMTLQLLLQLIFLTPLLGTQALIQKNSFKTRLNNLFLILKGQKLCPQDTKCLLLSARPTQLALYAVGVFFEYYSFDTGSSCSLIKRACLPKNCQTKTLESCKRVSTLAGKLQAQEVVTMRDIRLPEFDKNMRIDQHKCLVFDNDNCYCDIILGTIFLSKAGIKLNYKDETIEWFDTTLPLRPTGVGLKAEDFDAMVDSLHIQVENELFGEDWLQSFAIAMLDVKYEFTQV
jgi:hypothetical protein